MMVGQVRATKPSRSDEVLDAEEQVRMTNEIRAQLDALQPKRPIKPNRSEPDAALPQHPLHPADSFNYIPELHNLRSLQSLSHVHNYNLSLTPNADAPDDFVETQYYKELSSIDKQHHTTGSGFIKVVREGGYEIPLANSHLNIDFNAAQTKPRAYKSNPATNDWVPNSDECQEI